MDTSSTTYGLGDAGKPLRLKRITDGSTSHGSKSQFLPHWVLPKGSPASKCQSSTLDPHQGSHLAPETGPWQGGCSTGLRRGTYPWAHRRDQSTPSGSTAGWTICEASAPPSGLPAFPLVGRAGKGAEGASVGPGGNHRSWEAEADSQVGDSVQSRRLWEEAECFPHPT